MLKVFELGKSSPKILENCLSLSYSKEYYTPYSSFTGVFLLTTEVSEIIDVELFVNGTAIHKGIIDSVQITEFSSHKAIKIVSRGHTSMLGQNEIVPGLITQVSLNSLMTNYIQIPNVFHEDIATVSNYIYVKEHASLWEAVTNLCLKQKNSYPYIKNINTVCFNLPSSPKTVTLSRSNKNIVSCGNAFDYSKMISDIHMRDTQGTYNTFNYSESAVLSREIVRHKHIAFDKQWLDDPVMGIRYKTNFGMRGFKSSFVSYLGYNGEDINDLVNFETLINKSISRIDISGSSKGIVTKLTCYFDKYNNLGT